MTTEQLTPRAGTVLRLTGAAIFACLLAFAGCTKRQLQGDSPAYPVLDQIVAAPGVKATEFAGSLASDVQTYVKKTVGDKQVCVPTIYQDPGRATFHLALKDPGSAANATVPSPANTISLTNYHVHWLRSDGRMQQGVDVPFDFDGGITASLIGGNVTIAQLTIVRLQAKEEAPLKALIGGGGAIVISTIAEITFYGTDAAGHAVSVTGYINVDFSDWADPDC